MKNLLLLSSLVAFTACTVPPTKPPKTIHINVPDTPDYSRVNIPHTPDYSTVNIPNTPNYPITNHPTANIPETTDYATVDANHNNLLSRGTEMLSNKKASEAIMNYFNPIIRDYERRYASSKKPIFTARTQKEHDTYIRSSYNAKILSKTWSEAYYLKAYALLELNKINQAEETIDKALKLAPANSKYLSEAAHIYQVKKEFRSALSRYKLAEKSANLYTPKSLHKKELLRAKRGIAYNLIELREFNGAKKIYKEILRISPRDKIALKELKYIDELKKRR